MKVVSHVYDYIFNISLEINKELEKLFEKYPNGKIEVFNSFGCTNNLKLYNSLIF